MKAIKFKHQNCVFAENQPEYTPLPALKLDSKESHVITRWKLTFKERFILLFTGKFWMSTLTFNYPYQPVFMTTRRKDVFSLPTDKERIKEKKEVVPSNIKGIK